jgi:DNA-binding NtrC family response regulator
MHLTIVRDESPKDSLMPSDDPFFRILCVADDPAFQRLLKIALGRYGFDVITTVHGYDALIRYKANQGQFGAIISKSDLQQMNGLHFVGAVRKAGFKGRIIIIPGRCQREELTEYEPHGVSNFFHKPFDAAMLATMLLREE